MILNLDRPAARQAMTNPECSYWLRPGSEIRDSEIHENPIVENSTVENVSSEQSNNQNVAASLSFSTDSGPQHPTGNTIPDTGNQF